MTRFPWELAYLLVVAAILYFYRWQLFAVMVFAAILLAPALVDEIERRRR